jgi:hypothetical protein
MRVVLEVAEAEADAFDALDEVDSPGMREACRVLRMRYTTVAR